MRGHPVTGVGEMNNELRSFIKESLERGQSKDAIREVLAQAGWQDDEVRKGLSAFADVDYPLAVPRPTPYVHAREAFLYLISFIALYVSASSFGYLVFGFIDHAFPDALDFRDRYPSGGEATSIASVIVAFPLYLFLMKRLSTEVAVNPDKRLSLVRRWLTYLTLVIGAGIILGDIIALLANLLMGDPTLRFFLKGGVILLITTCIFGFYMWDMKRTETAVADANAKSALRALLGAVVVVVVAALGYSMFLLGTPGEQRDLRLDRQRVSDLSNIARNLNTYWSLNGTLPGSFEDMAGSRFSIRSVNDSESNDRYEYNALGDADYELCAVFSTDTAKSREARRTFSDSAWDHGIGRTCFQLKAEYVDSGPKPPSTITQVNPLPAPTPTPMPMPTVERDRLEGPPQGPGVEIGTGYPYALYVHCGIRDARFDGRLWMADPMLSDGSGNPPPDWTAEDSRGTMEVVRDDLAVFTAESGRIVEFIPWPLDVEWRPCA